MFIFPPQFSVVSQFSLLKATTSIREPSYNYSLSLASVTALQT